MMLDISAELTAKLASSFTMVCDAQSWLDDQLLADSIPINSGSISLDRSQSVPESLSFIVPIKDGADRWDPTTVDHPLSAYGQRISLRIGVYVNGDVEWMQQGWFPIIQSQSSDTTVSVNAVGMLHLIDEAKFTAPFEPTSSFTDTIQALVEPAITCVFDPTLVDRLIPVGMHWDEDRLGALQEVLDAWPADAEVTSDGYLNVHPIIDDSALTSVWSLTDDPSNGTVIRWMGDTSRDGAFNCVVARGENPSGAQIQAVVYDTDPLSSTYIFGPFSALPVPQLFYSPLLSTLSQCTAAAHTIMGRKKRNQSRKLEFECVPNPALQVGDAVIVTSLSLSIFNILATIESFTSPLTPSDGSMRGTLRVVE